MADAECFTESLVEVDSPNVTYTAESIEARTKYDTTEVETTEAGRLRARPRTIDLTVRTERRVPRTGVLIVGWGGNNGTTVTASLLAHREGVTWRTKKGEAKPDFLGSVTMASTVRLGTSAATGRDVYVPMRSLVPMVDPVELEIGGWDISRMNLGEAMRRAEVLPVELQDRLYERMSKLRPLPGVYIPDFIAANQADRADNVLEGARCSY